MPHLRGLRLRGWTPKLKDAFRTAASLIGEWRGCADRSGCAHSHACSPSLTVPVACLDRRYRQPLFHNTIYRLAAGRCAFWGRAGQCPPIPDTHRPSATRPNAPRSPRSGLKYLSSSCSVRRPCRGDRFAEGRAWCFAPQPGPHGH